MRKGIKNLRKQLFIVTIFLLAGVTAFAQRTVTGRITDTNGNGIPGITVTVKGTRTATQTSSDGSYSINAPANSRLVFTSVGFATQEIAVNGRTSFDLTMSPANAQLNEVVVIGYGTRQKKDLTGSITQVSSKDFQKGAITSAEQLIAGKVAGVSIVSNSGQPGAGSTIRIRGGSSLTATNDPLYVIDGVPFENRGIAGGFNPLSFISANDIETFTVLKDASASAIYGTRAANGVIIITTKKGRAGKLKVNFSTVNSLSVVRDYVDVLNPEQLKTIVNANGSAAQKAQLGTANTNWQKEIYQKAFGSDNNLSFTGGIKNLPYRAALGYLDQQGILKTDRMRRLSAAISVNPVLFNDHLKIDLNVKGIVQKNRFANQGAIGSAVFFDPTQPVRNNGKRFGGYFEFTNASGVPIGPRNPVAMLYDWHDDGKAQRSIGNIQLDYKFHFLPDLHANLNLGYDIAKGDGTQMSSDSSAIGFGDPTLSTYIGGGYNHYYRSDRKNSLLDFYFLYTKDISAIKTRMDLQVGYSYNNFRTIDSFYSAYYTNGKVIPNSVPKDPYNIPEHWLSSYFGRANFVIADRYLLTGTIRRDESSNFSQEFRVAYFPSVAFAWNLKNESFLKNTRGLSALKLRLGYGITGQQEIGLYQNLARYSLSNQGASYYFGDVPYQMLRPAGYNGNLKWEETATTNAGFDYGFADNRVNGSVDFYIKKTKDLLNSVPQPAGTNFSQYVITNVGSMENKGVEFNINVQPVKRPNLTWDVSFNATYNKNTITGLSFNDSAYAGFPSQSISGTSGFAFINAVGYPKSTFNLLRQVYDKNTGSPIEGLFEDVNRDGIINEKDYYKSESATPDVFFGFSTNLNYKKWNAGFVLRASFNNYVYNNIYSNYGKLTNILQTQVVGNASVNYLNTQFRGVTDQQLLSDYYIENASFLKMDNFNIGYNAGRVLHNKASMGLNFSVQNVFTITKYSGIEPELNNGIDYNLYPRPRIFALGLNFDF